MILRAQQIETIVLSGIATSGVVLSTLRQAADKDFDIKVLEDACFDPDPHILAPLKKKSLRLLQNRASYFFLNICDQVSLE